MPCPSHESRREEGAFMAEGGGGKAGKGRRKGRVGLAEAAAAETESFDKVAESFQHLLDC